MDAANSNLAASGLNPPENKSRYSGGPSVLDGQAVQNRGPSTDAIIGGDLISARSYPWIATLEEKRMGTDSWPVCCCVECEASPSD